MARREANISLCCDVCAEEFSHEKGRIPKVLVKCGHSYCENCLTKLQRTKHHATVHYTRTISNFSGTSFSNFSGKYGEELYKKCSKNSLEYEIVCPKCKEKTVSDKPCSFLPKNYAYLDIIDEVIGSRKKQKYEGCEEHPDYVRDMFCHDENELMCLYCATYGQHKGHNVSRVSGFSDHQKTSIKYQIDTLQEIILNHDKLSGELEVREQELMKKVEFIREHIQSKFELAIQEIKGILDEKLNSVFHELHKISSAQLSLIQDAKEKLNSQALKDIQKKAKLFLSGADDCKVAKETDFLNEVQAKIDEVQDYMVCTEHVYEVQVNSPDCIVQIVKDMVNAWVCCVEETKVESLENVSTILDKYSPSYGDSLNILFGEKIPNEQLTENPFGRIDCKFLCDGVLDSGI